MGFLLIIRYKANTGLNSLPITINYSCKILHFASLMCLYMYYKPICLIGIMHSFHSSPYSRKYRFLYHPLPLYCHFTKYIIRSFSCKNVKHRFILLQRLNEVLLCTIWIEIFAGVSVLLTAYNVVSVITRLNLLTSNSS